jgi:hypothetical protein
MQWLESWPSQSGRISAKLISILRSSKTGSIFQPTAASRNFISAESVLCFQGNVLIPLICIDIGMKWDVVTLHLRSLITTILIKELVTTQWGSLNLQSRLIRE